MSRPTSKKGTRPGRPTAFTPELGEEIAVRLAEGESLRQICADEHMPARSTVSHWACDPAHPFFGQHARARECQAHGWADRILEIADAVVAGGLDPNAGRVAIDALKWTASRMGRRFYGERVEIAKPVSEVDQLTDADLAQIADEIVGKLPTRSGATKRTSTHERKTRG